jgi:two-component system NtrC family sensor kinase
VTGERLLVVDDSADMRSSLADALLNPMGFEVLLAENGAEGLVRALADRPDLIITDQAMPDMTGLEMMHSLREAGHDIPTIMITGEGSESIAIQAFRLGAVDYLRKPLDPDQLLAAIRRGLQQEPLPDAPTLRVTETDTLRALLEIGQSITASLELEMVLGQVLEEAVRLSGAEIGELMLLDLETEELYTRASKTLGEGVALNLHLPVADKLAVRVINNGEPLLSSDGKNLLYIPLILLGQVIGVLGVSSLDPARTFSVDDVEVLSVLANYATIAIANARAFEESRIERARFRNMLERSSDAVLVIDELGYVILINQGACEALDVDSLNILGRTINDSTDNPDLRGLFEMHDARHVSRGEVSLPDGRTLNAQLTTIEGMGLVAVMQEVTHLKELDRMKTKFVTTVSHDLRSPLTGILGYVELLHRVGELNDEQRGFVERIKTGVDAMTNLINDLLDLGRIEAGMDREKENVHLRPILLKVYEGIQSEITAKQLEFELNCPKELPMVLGNPLRLRQALSNLIDNAIKYTPEEGNVSVTVDVTGDHLILEVRDTGVGIPLADQPHVFDEFYRAEAVTKSHQGTGLGLAIVKSIIEAHEGRVWVDSKVGEGSTFTVTLPTLTPGKGLMESPRAP